ncbi:uncharacterized protein LOC132628549 [Lycium barbarum]|uniref:uncharacterized protein LOC132628549 n=1 Tax=Lycium barbarum TaxID=112863 RepID=UPI00293F3464|nr:uncharacterized protein LOC132628549 [Lycium barbarum]
MTPSTSAHSKEGEGESYEAGSESAEAACSGSASGEPSVSEEGTNESGSSKPTDTLAPNYDCSSNSIQSKSSTVIVVVAATAAIPPPQSAAAPATSASATTSSVPPPPAQSGVDLLTFSRANYREIAFKTLKAEKQIGAQKRVEEPVLAPQANLDIEISVKNLPNSEEEKEELEKTRAKWPLDVVDQVVKNLGE